MILLKINLYYRKQEAQKGIMVACPLNWEASVSSKVQ